MLPSSETGFLAVSIQYTTTATVCVLVQKWTNRRQLEVSSAAGFQKVLSAHPHHAERVFRGDAWAECRPVSRFIALKLHSKA